MSPRLLAGSQAELAGLEVGDTIVEINGNPPGQESTESVAALSPGDTIAVKIQSRRNGERELKWKVGGREEISYDLKDLENVTSAQRAAPHGLAERRGAKFADAIDKLTRAQKRCEVIPKMQEVRRCLAQIHPEMQK